MSSSITAPADMANATSPAWARRWAGVVVCVALCASYLVVQPASVDYASGSFRARLFGTGSTVWNNAWFGGHALPGYGLIPPMLGSWFGVVPVGIAAALVATFLLTLVVERCAEARPLAVDPTLTTVLLAFSCALNLWSGRLTFGPSVAFGAGCILCLQRRRHVGAVLCAVCCGLSSPVGAVSLAIVLAGCWVARSFPRRMVTVVLAGAIVPIGFLGLAFPEGGWYPFTGNGLVLLLVALAFVGWTGRRERVVICVMAVYAAAALGAFVVRTPLGGNVVRLGWLAAGPAAVWGMRRHRRGAIAIVAALSILWGWSYAKMAFLPKDVTAAEHFYDPLAAQVASMAGGVQRVEVVPTATFRQADELALQLSLARGWDTQLDRKFNETLYSPALDATAYHHWLVDNSVTLVALPLGPLQSAARREAAVIRARPTYLQLVWSDADWELFRVADAPALATNGATVTTVHPESLAIDAPRAGVTIVRFRYTPLYDVTRGDACVTRAPDGWIDVHVRRPGPIVLEVRLSARGLLGPARACT